MFWGGCQETFRESPRYLEQGIESPECSHRAQQRACNSFRGVPCRLGEAPAPCPWEMTDSLQSGEKSWNIIIPEEQQCWKPPLFQTLTGIKSLTQKHSVDEGQDKVDPQTLVQLRLVISHQDEIQPPGLAWQLPLAPPAPPRTDGRGPCTR